MIRTFLVIGIIIITIRVEKCKCFLGVGASWPRHSNQKRMCQMIRTRGQSCRGLAGRCRLGIALGGVVKVLTHRVVARARLSAFGH